MFFHSKFARVNNLQKIVSEIKYRTGHSLEVIAKNINYTRPHLNTALLKGEGPAIQEQLIKFYRPYLIDYFSTIKPNDTMKNNQPSDGHFPSQALADLAQSNKNNSEAIKNNAEAIKAIAKSNESLAALLQTKSTRADREKSVLESAVATIAALRDYTLDLAVNLKRQPREKLEQEFYKKVGEHLDKNERKDKARGR